MRGKLIVIEGTDCSGKETQSKLLSQKLNDLGIENEVIDFPNYNSPTGRIFGSCYLGKEYLCKEHLVSKNGWFPEGASNVEPLVASLLVAADRKYNIKKVNDLLDSGVNVILDRYVYSNMAHQGCKITDEEKRKEFINKMEMLEFDLLELPIPDLIILLYMPVEQSNELKQKRQEKADQHEVDIDYLFRAESTYLFLKDLYDMVLINCTDLDKIRSKEEINNDLLNIVLNIIKKKENTKCKKILK